MGGSRKRTRRPRRRSTRSSSRSSRGSSPTPGSRCRRWPSRRDAARGYRETLAAFLATPQPGGSPLNEAACLELTPSALSERCNGLVESCRRSARRDAAQAAESFVVFFQALVPTLSPEPAREVKATFFRLIPTLVQMAWEDSAEGSDNRREGKQALGLLETILLEVSSVRLAPVESGLLFKSLDQLATLIAACDCSQHGRQDGY